MRYYLKVDPDELSEDKWCELWSGLKWVLEEKNKVYNSVMKDINRE